VEVTGNKGVLHIGLKSLQVPLDQAEWLNIPKDMGLISPRCGLGVQIQERFLLLSKEDLLHLYIKITSQQNSPCVENFLTM